MASSYTHLVSQANDLKEQLWAFMDAHDVVNPKLKDAMNEVLDYIDLMEDEISEA